MLFFVEILTLYIAETRTEFLLYLPELHCRLTCLLQNIVTSSDTTAVHKDFRLWMTMHCDHGHSLPGEFWNAGDHGRNYSPRRPAMRGGGRRVKGNLCRWEKEIVALGPTSADHLIFILQVKQGYINGRNAT